MGENIQQADIMQRSTVRERATNFYLSIVGRLHAPPTHSVAQASEMPCWRCFSPAALGVFAYLGSLAFLKSLNLPLLALAVAGIVAALFPHQRVSVVRYSYAIPCLLALSFLLSLLFSEDVSRSLELSAALLPAFLLYFLVTLYFNKATDMALLCGGLSLLGLTLSIPLLFISVTHDLQFNTASEVTPWIVWSPILVSRNDLAILAITSPFAIILALRNPRSGMGAIGAISAILGFATVVAYQSRGATLAWAVSAIALAVLLRRRAMLMILAATASFALMFDMYRGFPLVRRFVELLMNPASELLRIKEWQVAWNMFLEKPLFGHGPHSFSHYFYIPWPHNLYLETLAEMGLIGFLALGFALCYSLIVSFRATRAVTSDRYLAAASVSALLAFALASLIELSFIRQWVVVMFLLLLAVALKTGTPNTKESES